MSERKQPSGQTSHEFLTDNSGAGEASLQTNERNLDTSRFLGNKDDYIKKWLRSLTILHRGHWDAARYYEKVNILLGLAIAISATFSGTSAFSQLQQAGQGRLNVWLQIAVGFFALIAAAFGALQAAIRPSELAVHHKKAAQKFGKLRREIELHLSLGLPLGHQKQEVLLTEFRSKWDTVDEESLPLPKRFYDNAVATYNTKDPIYTHKLISSN
ncbi:MAG: SLATT domain-containing protein [Bacteroidales bacterium]